MKYTIIKDSDNFWTGELKLGNTIVFATGKTEEECFKRLKERKLFNRVKGVLSDSIDSTD